MKKVLLVTALTKNKKEVIVSMKKVLLVTALIVLFITQMIFAGAQAEEKIILKASGGGTSSTSFTWLIALQMLLDKYTPNLRLDVFPSKGRVEDVRFLITDIADIATAYEWNLRAAREGKDAYSDLGPQDIARVLFTYTTQCGHIITLKNSPIQTFSYDDIKGKTILTRETGSSGYAWTVQSLQGIGLDYRKDVKILNMGLADMIEALKDGNGDIMMSTQTVPTAVIQELFNSKPCKIIPMPVEAIKKANEVQFLGTVTGFIPAGIYKGVDKPVQAAILPSVVIVRKDVPDDIVYQVVKVWWEHIEERNECHPTIKNEATVEELKKYLKNQHTPFHNGALKYYKEKGWTQ